MQNTEATKLVNEVLGSPFDRGGFGSLAKNILKKLDDRSENSTFSYSGNLIPDAFKGHVSKYERLGKYQDPSSKHHTVDVLIVHLAKTDALDRARTMQRNFIARYLNGSRGGQQKDAALVAFVAPNRNDWRFSLVRMDYKDFGTKKELSPARRYSFLVGQDEQTHTARTQLVDILTSDELPDIEVLTSAFNVEKVGQEFFERYKELFLQLKEALDGMIESDKSIARDFSSKEVRSEDFAKKLLGQVVFLYFLQKKGWLGVPKEKTWGEGPKDFLRRLYLGKYGEYSNFFNDVLEPLFYEALSTERSKHYYDRLKSKIPFLNGGLFEPIDDYDWVDTDVLIPDKLFSNSDNADLGTGILDVFDRYNFTVKEDEPLDKEVAVDPEMLGKVFENLLDVRDRRSKGSYYTPREIVHYMCQASLLNYLDSRIDGKISRSDLESFLRTSDMVVEHDSLIQKRGKETSAYQYKLPENVRAYADKIDSLLSEVRVCDPAIGSGAYPVGMMHEIVRARQVLAIFSSKPFSAYQLKLDVIQNSLFGVNIDSGAVEIAKLRLWLSLVVDENSTDEIDPLPNLDYRIMQGNSLVEDFGEIELFDAEVLKDESSREGKKLAVRNLKKQVETLEKEYLSLHKSSQLTDARKKAINKEIRRTRRRLKLLAGSKTDDRLSLFSDKGEVDYKQVLRELFEKFFDASHKKEKDQLRSNIEEIQWHLIESSLVKEGKADKIDEIEDLRSKKQRPFFIWHLYFLEVFEEKGGFDIVLGNPPYLESRHPNFSESMKDDVQRAAHKRWPQDADKITRGSDLLVYFFELGLSLVNKSGQVILLTQNSWLDTEYGKKFQEFLLKHSKVESIIDSDFKHFDSRLGPNINTIITTLRSGGNEKSNTYLAKFHENYSDMPLTLSSKLGKLATIKNLTSDSGLLQKYKWGFILSSNQILLEAVDALSKSGQFLSELDGISVGQGLNVSKSSIYEKSLLKKFPFVKKATVPIATSADKPKFEITSVECFLVDSTRLSEEEREKLKKAEINLYTSSSTSKDYPTMSLPRGLSDKHYCTVHEIKTHTASAVDLYSEKDFGKDLRLLNIWAVLNSTLGWLIRETSGRKNLGGGMLKAEAVDLKAFPLYLDLKKDKQISKIFTKTKGRLVKSVFEEMKTEEHKAIDRIVFDHLSILPKNRKGLIDLTLETVRDRYAKSKT
ncbi:MAG: Eco57I restriction-modification methylase domain-containing protein [Patescibacteria group bacterium]